MSLWKSFVLSATAGLLLGSGGPLLMSTGGPVAHVAHLILSAGWIWAALAFCIGMIGKSRPQSAGLAVCSLVVAVFAYYLTKASGGDFRSIDPADPTCQRLIFSWKDFLSVSVVWSFFALILGSVLGVAGNVSRGNDRYLIAKLIIPVVALGEGVLRIRSEGSLQGSLFMAAWSATCVTAAAVILYLAGAAFFGSRIRRTVRQNREPYEAEE